MIKFTKYKQDIFVVILLLLVILIYLLQFLGTGLESIFGDLGDARLNNYFLEHGYQYLIGNHSSFWSAPFYYPAQNVMTYSDNHLGTLPFYSLFRLLDYDIETSYQLWMILIFLLNGISTYVILRLFKFNILGSFSGALLFAISAPVMLKTGHFQLIPRFMVPIIFYAGLKYVESFNIKYFYIFSFAFVYQFYIGIYIGFFAIISFIILLPLMFVYIKNNHNLKSIFNKKYISQFVLISILSVVLLYLLFSPYLAYKEVSGGRSWDEIASMLPRLASWIYTSGSYFNIFNTIGTHLPMQHEHIIFLGVVPYVLFFTIIFLYSKKSDSEFFAEYKNIILVSLATIFLIFLVTLFIGGGSLYKYTFYQIPGFDAIRAVTRIMLFLAFPFAVLLAFMITIISKSNFNFLNKIGLLGFILLFGAFEQYRVNIATYDKHQAQERYLNIYQEIKDISDYDLIYVQRTKPSSSFYADELDAMFVSLMINKPTINGYSGNTPQGYNLWNQNNPISWEIANKESFVNKRLLVVTDDTSEVLDIDNSILSKNVTQQKVPLESFANELELVRVDNINTNEAKVVIKVTNTSSEKSRAHYAGKYGLAVSYKFSNNKINTGYDFGRYFLPYDINPGESAIVEIPIQKQSLVAGENNVTISMAQEGVAWFHDKGSVLR